MAGSYGLALGSGADVADCDLAASVEDGCGDEAGGAGAGAGAAGGVGADDWLCVVMAGGEGDCGSSWG